MGMDEHGQKVDPAADRAGTPPQEWVDRIGQRFESTWRQLHCSHDDWIRTTEPRHARGGHRAAASGSSNTTPTTCS